MYLLCCGLNPANFESRRAAQRYRECCAPLTLPQQSPTEAQSADVNPPSEPVNLKAAHALAYQLAPPVPTFLPTELKIRKMLQGGGKEIILGV